MPQSDPTSGKIIGRALLVGRRIADDDAAALAVLGLHVEMSPDPYAAMAELTSRPLVYRTLVLPIPELFPEELALAQVVKTRYPHIRIIASDVPEQSARLEDLRRFGIQEILSDGRVQPIVAPAPESPSPPVEKSKSSPEPVLTAEELRALLDDDTPSTRRRVE
ncbi:MAG TPA: hypothetical protein VG722_11610 [Tepidisphaeraceae bacterium]|nr:hypothetical protein [Tepidisphaeraceae bacterium]